MTSDDTASIAPGRFLADDPATACRRAAGQVDALGERVIEALRTVYDPEIPVNIYELGLVYKIDVEDDEQVLLEMTLTSPHCPVAETLPGEVEHKVAAVEGVKGCEVKVVWDPPWNPVDDDRGSAARAGHDLLAGRIRPSDRRALPADDRVCRLTRRPTGAGLRVCQFNSGA